MNNLPREISYQGNIRMVNGIPVVRDADYGIIFEKNLHLQIAKKYLDILQEGIDFYDGWDREVVNYEIANGKTLAMTFAQGPSFAASAVERFVRTGVSHIVRIGTCGSLDSIVNKWDVVISNAAIRNEATTDAYITKEYPAVSDPFFSLRIYDELLKNKDLGVHIGITFTNCARYKENQDQMRMYNQLGNVLNVDMETSSILLVSSLYGIKASSIGLSMDIPSKSEKEVFEDKGSLKVSQFHGSTDHLQYSQIVPSRIEFLLKKVISIYESL